MSWMAKPVPRVSGAEVVAAVEHDRGPGWLVVQVGEEIELDHRDEKAGFTPVPQVWYPKLIL